MTKESYGALTGSEKVFADLLLEILGELKALHAEIVEDIGRTVGE